MKKLLIFCILFLFAQSGFCTDYFVRDDAGGSGNGLTDATAFTLAQANLFSFGTSDRLFFKCDDTWTRQSLYVYWSGTALNPVVIGAYYGSGTIGVSGNKPIFDGATTYPGVETPLIHVVSSNYVTVTNLNIKNSSGYGIRFRLSDYGVLSNTAINYAWNNTIAWSESDHGTIEWCSVTQSDMKYGTTGVRPWGSAVGIRASEYVTVKNCLVYQNYGEGINFYQGSHNGVAEYNLLYDNRAVQMYMDGDSNCVFRFNMMYGSSDTDYHRYTNYVGIGIYITDEAWDGDQVTTGNEVYGNLIANCYRGIMTDSVADFTNYKIYNNEIVGCGVGLSIASDTYTTSEIKNNLVWSTGNSSAVGSIPATTTGLTWSNQLWSDGATDHPGTNDVIGDPLLYKTTGWNTITAGSLNEIDFSLLSGSPAIDAGATIGADYDDGLNLSTTTLPGTVALIDQDGYGSTWEIGPIYTGGAAIVDPTGYITPRNLTEGIMRTAGVTVTITLTDATWGATVGDDNALTTALIAGIDSNMSESTGWDAIVKAALTNADVTRTSDSVVTIVIPAFAAFDIGVSETVSTIIPASCTSAGTTITCNDFIISAIQTATTSRGMIGSSAAGDLIGSSTGKTIYHKE